MPMIDVYAAVGTLSDKNQLAQEPASAVMLAAAARAALSPSG
jgi:hypothetical protein